MTIEVKDATLKDLPPIQAMNLELFKLEEKTHDATLDTEWVYGEKGTNYFTKKIAGEDGCVLLAVVEGEAAGYLCGGLREAAAHRSIKSVAELENMFVYEAYRSQGIGAKLVNAFVAWCKDQNVECIKATAYSSNEKALGFYLREGFAEYSVTLERMLK